MSGAPLVEVDALRVRFGALEAVRGVSFSVAAGETLGIVGESGCGKSLTALALIGLLPDAANASGRLRFEGRDLLSMNERDWCRLRGERVGMIFQEPMTALNPLHTVGRQIGEGLRLHRDLSRARAREEARRLLELVAIEQPARRLDDYPHQLSGGQRQRVMIAMALANRPSLLIADEPTTALDVTVQKQVLALIGDLVLRLDMAMVLISHDLAVVSGSVERVVVMYGGMVVETGPADALFDAPAHPYTRALLAALPRLGASAGDYRLAAIPGSVPRPDSLPPGCAFAPRCALAVDACREAPPPLAGFDASRAVACPRVQPHVEAEAVARG